LIFAGEIYNFLELRQQLTALGHTFKTRSDTEVILRGYLQWGADVAARLNGMFSLAIWTPARRSCCSYATGWA
jgi:asparagine synthase (glutamine-hydrolysing)